ncbi:phosphomevalonate kinase [Linnemannia schmuckeri]|uniref:Phosphomevalonate kinase n=1 Tax=Linnemannia schmuckeri TaxID=64567 RepID=A0A9P5RXV7_9FUNG|nr:phosphomevalonate kinase [Linnemannia schmuckeri]
MASTDRTTIISAPGKVLLTGGYLVLDPAFSGLVVATDARFYTLIRPGRHSATTEPYKVVVRSPQFDNATWTYWITLQGTTINFSPNKEDDSRNTFVELALNYSFAMLVRLVPAETLIKTMESGLEIVIAGNNDFYSQRKELETRGLSLNTESLRQIPLFASTHTTLSKVHKTGLGSSAALITSLVAAIFIHFDASKLQQDDTTNTQFLHNVAQFVHCLAQGKVGSGFDVSSAVWGSHTYRRFSPEVLQSVMHQDAIQDIPALLKIVTPKETAWDNVVVPFKLAPRLHLMLADIDAGSHTPTLVSNVVELLKELDQVAKNHPEAYDRSIQKASAVVASEWSGLVNQTITNEDVTFELLVKIYNEFLTVRRYLREMSKLSEVPVEPEEQTRLLDACMTVPGVLMAGVPGAGGYDAIFCIVLSDESRKGVEGVWSGFQEMSVGPLLCQESVEGGLVVELGHGHGDDRPLSKHTPTVQRLLQL